MIRYVTRASWDPDDYPTGSRHIDVHEPDKRPADTGLLDQFGNRLFRHEIREPIGFRINDRSPTVTAS